MERITAATTVETMMPMSRPAGLRAIRKTTTSTPSPIIASRMVCVYAGADS